MYVRKCKSYQNLDGNNIKQLLNWGYVAQMVKCFPSMHAQSPGLISEVHKLGVLAHVCNLCTLEGEAVGPGDQGQS